MNYLKNLYLKIRPRVDSTCAIVALLVSTLAVVGLIGWVVSSVVLLLLKLFTLPILVPTVVATVAAVVWGYRVIWVDELSRSELVSLGTLLYTMVFGGAITLMCTIEKILASEDKV
jgi:hypothetical protein